MLRIYFLLVIFLSLNKAMAIEFDPMTAAIDQNNIEVCDSLFKAGYPVNGINGFVPLSYAIQKNNVKIFNHILSYKPDINKKNSKQLTPLMTALYFGSEQLVDDLFVAGADPLLRTTYGFQAVDFGLEKPVKKEALSELFYCWSIYLTDKEDSKSFYKSIKKNDLSNLTDSQDYSSMIFNVLVLKNLHLSLSKLCELGFDINKSNASGYSPLMLSVRLGDIPAVSSLVERCGAELVYESMPSKDIPFALNQAVRGNQTEMIQWLLDFGVHPDQGNKRGFTPLILCGYYDDSTAAMTSKLLDSGADPFNRSDLNEHLFNIAFRQGKWSILKKILESSLKKYEHLMQMIRKAEYEKFAMAWAKTWISRDQQSMFLMYALVHNDSLVTHTILSRDSTIIDQKNNSGYYPLSMLIRNENSQLMQGISKKYRLENKTNEDPQLNSLIHLSIFYANHSALNLFLKEVENINITNRDGIHRSM